MALVTGASAGIGDAIARTLHADGYRVAVCARRHQRLRQLAHDLGDRVLPCPTDLRREADIMALFARIRSTWGRLDVLVNNAGLGHDAPLCSGATEHWREMLEVNVLALAVCTREAIAAMGTRAGHIVHISSMSAHRVPAGSGMYSATKFAVRSLTEGLRLELQAAGSPIRVSSISPGFVRTEFAEHYHGDPAKAEQTYGRFEVLRADDVADTVRFVLSRPQRTQIHDILLRPTEQPS